MKLENHQVHKSQIIKSYIYFTIQLILTLSFFFFPTSKAKQLSVAILEDGFAHNPRENQSMHFFFFFFFFTQLLLTALMNNN